MRIGRECFTPDSSNHSLYLIKLVTNSSYPGGNFGLNQLLDVSISLSPLYPNSTNDLHVSNASSLHQSFLWLHFIQAKVNIFRVPTDTLMLKPLPRDGRPIVRVFTPSNQSCFHYASKVCHLTTCVFVRLLGPCFKTGRLKPFRQHPNGEISQIPTRKNLEGFLHVFHSVTPESF